MYIRVDVTFPISESSTVNAAASWISICLTICLCLGFSPDRSIWSSTFLCCSLILISGTTSVLVSLFTSFATVDTTAWRSCTCTVWDSCFYNGVMLEICWILLMVVFFHRMIPCLELYNTGIHNQWFVPGLTVTIVLSLNLPVTQSLLFRIASIFGSATEIELAWCIY